MEVLPSGSTALLVELDGLSDVLALYAALRGTRPPGGRPAPAARTLLVTVDPVRTTLADVERAVREAAPIGGRDGPAAALLEVPVIYDGEDLPASPPRSGCAVAAVIRRAHRGSSGTVAFCGIRAGLRLSHRAAARAARAPPGDPAHPGAGRGRGAGRAVRRGVPALLAGRLAARRAHRRRAVRRGPRAARAAGARCPGALPRGTLTCWRCWRRGRSRPCRTWDGRASQPSG